MSCTIPGGKIEYQPRQEVLFLYSDAFVMMATVLRYAYRQLEGMVLGILLDIVSWDLYK